MALQPPLQARATLLGLAAPNGHTAQQILPIPESGRMVKCEVCEDCGWVCESRPDSPWEGEHNQGQSSENREANVWPRLYLGRSNRVREQ